jgi:hAT family C-terminal dimerisation region
MFYLKMFDEIFGHVNILFNIFQKESASTLSARNSIENFKNVMTEMKANIHKFEFVIDENDSSFKQKRGYNFTNIVNGAKIAIDVLISNLTDRLLEQEYSKSFEIINVQHFKNNRGNFPQHESDVFTKIYDFINKERLKNELKIMYTSHEFQHINKLTSLLKFFIDNNLKDTFKETITVIQLVLTAPIASAEAERCFSTLKRIKTFLRNTMGENRLNSLAVLSMEWDFINKIPNFNEKVMDLFAKIKNRRAEYIFK